MQSVFFAMDSTRPLTRLRLALIFLATLLLRCVSATDLGSAQVGEELSASWYDWGGYGAFPRRSYESFGAQSPRPLLAQTSPKCDDGYIFVGPRGMYVETPGPIILDNGGNLVWMQTRWGEAMDVKVQQYKGNNYITFWHGSDNGTFGEGFYLMIDESYEVYKKVLPVGDYSGDLHEFRITDQDTALMTIYHRARANMESFGIPQGWIFDSIFQEIDLETGELIFEWRASEHFPVNETLAPLSGEGARLDRAFDYFHINSVDKDPSGNYLISSRYMCAVAAISGDDGRVLWQLGGVGNSFEDLSGGAATDFTWNHHAAWIDNTTLTVFDNAANGRTKPTYKFSRGLMVSLDFGAMTATLEQDFISPQRALTISQGSVQLLPNGNVFVGWGHVAAFTEFDRQGRVLCDTHIGPINLDLFAWVKNYRTFKYDWTGRPKTLPDVAVRPGKKATFVSWNGATEVARWRLQSGASEDGDGFQDHQTIAKTGFETRLDIPSDAGEYIRVTALDADGKILAHSRVASSYEKTVVPLLEAPSRGGWLEPFHILCLSVLGSIVGASSVYCFRSTLRRGVNKVLRRGSETFKYTALPTHS